MDLLSLVPASAFGVALALFFGGTKGPFSELVRRLERTSYGTGLERDLRYLRSRYSARDLLSSQLVLIFAAAGVGFVSAWTALGLVLVVAVSPRFMVAGFAEKRAGLLSAQLIPFLEALGRSLAASPSLADALFQAGALGVGPLREELAETRAEMELGLPLDASLVRLGERSRSLDFRLALLTLRVSRRTGGEIRAVLCSTVDAFREQRRLQGLLRTKTAEGRAQAWVISVIPFPLVGAVHLVAPGFFEPLTTTNVGGVLIALAGLLWGLALLTARRILRVEL